MIATSTEKGLEIKLRGIASPNRHVWLKALEIVQSQLQIGALSGEADYEHRYIATGQSESDSYTLTWRIG